MVGFQRPLEGSNVLRNLLGARGAGQGAPDCGVIQDPSDCRLRGVLPIALSDFLDSIDVFQIAFESFRLELRVFRPDVVGGNHRPGRKSFRQESFGQYVVGDHSDSHFCAIGKFIPLDIATENIVGNLQNIDPPPLLRLHEFLSREIRTADESNLALISTLCKGLHCLRDRRVRIGPMNQVQRNLLQPEACKACLNRLKHMSRRAISPGLSARIDGYAELGNDHDVSNAFAQSAAQYLFRVTEPVDVGGVEHRYSEVQSAMDRLDGLVIVDRSPAVASDGPAPHSDARSDEVCSAELGVFHQRSTPKIVRRIVMKSDHTVARTAYSMLTRTFSGMMFFK